jgi:hypothetical protein
LQLQPLHNALGDKASDDGVNHERRGGGNKGVAPRNAEGSQEIGLGRERVEGDK